MSSCLRNLKFSAQQSYLSLKPLLFRTQSCPTIGFNPCIEHVRSPIASTLVHVLSTSVEESRKKPIEIGLEEVVPVSEICHKLLTKQTSLATLTTNSETISSLCRIPEESLPKIKNQDKASRVYYGSPISTTEIYLCNQLREHNVTIFSGFLEASPYHIFCIGAENHHRLNATPLSALECQAMRFAETPSPKTTPHFPGKASEEQLHKIFTALSECLPKFFARSHDYTIYHGNIIFENNIRGVTTRGISAYVQQLSLVRILGHLRYAHVKLEILKMTQHPEDGTVRVRWRIAGVSGIRVLFMIWKFRLWEWKKMLNKEKEWIDGFSIFHVGSDGLIYKHICDKMMPDDNREVVKASGGGMAVKLALMLGLVPKDSIFDGLADGALMPITSVELQ